MTENQETPTNESLQELKRLILEVSPGKGNRRQFDEPLRKRVVSEFERLNLSTQEFCQECQISASSLHKWRRSYGEGEMRGSFRRVKTAERSQSESLIQLEGPHGLRFSGLSLSQACELIRRLA